ncbi:MAG: hypothetical protein J6S84_09085 [Bacteroidales bacterium]|nr:hypothetical protein [Bacteroidales bacterium]
MDFNIHTDEKNEQEATKLCSLIKEAIPTGTDEAIILLAFIKYLSELAEKKAPIWVMTVKDLKASLAGEQPKNQEI